jgi:hypothetical protein
MDRLKVSSHPPDMLDLCGYGVEERRILCGKAV